MKEPGTVVIDGVKKVLLHPKLSGSKPRVFNLALLFFKAPVSFSKYISPVCLRHSEDKMTGQTVFAAGFGVDMHGNLAGYKKQMPMTVVDSPTCQKFFLPTMQKGKASNFFCARGNGQETPCRYDKPLYVKHNDRWFLRAMSSSFKVFKNKLCRPRAPVLYEDISFMLDWIESEISDNKVDDWTVGVKKNSFILQTLKSRTNNLNIQMSLHSEIIVLLLATDDFSY